MTGSFNKTTMKFKLFLFALIALLMASCAREPLPEPNIEQEGKLVTIRAAIPQETRVSYDDATLKLAWEPGDQLMLVGYDDNGAYKGHNVFTFQTGSSGNFTGEAVSGATKYKAYYPADAIFLDPNYGVHFDKLWQQTQNGNNSTAHLGDKLCLCDESGHGLDQLFTLAAKNNILRLNLTGMPEWLGTLKRLIWTVEYETGCTRSTCLDITNYTYTSGDELIAYLAFDPTVTRIIANGEVRITLIGDLSYEWKATTNKPNGMNYAQGNTRYYASVSDGWLSIAPLMYTIRTNDPNTDYGIKQPSASSINPCHMTIYWGDGTENTFLAQNSTLSPERFASHNYTGVGDYTITIISDQPGAVKQMPQITFYEHIGNNIYESDTLLTAVLTPFPGMAANSFEKCFYGCNQLTSIPADLFRFNTQATSFFGTFCNCTSLTEIPANLFRSNGAAIDFQQCFQNCPELTTLPAGLFNYNTQAKYFSMCFQYCTKLATIPGDLFGSANTNNTATYFGNCFANCPALTTIPAGLFSNNPNAFSFSGCFKGCTALTDIPAGLFSGNTQAKHFRECFEGCTSLTTVPAGLFSNNTKAIRLNRCFAECTSLTTIQGALLGANMQDTTSFIECFQFCTKLTNIPADLFGSNTQATNFTRCFEYCTYLTSLPQGLFGSNANTQATIFESCFKHCISLTTVPTGLFSNYPQATTFESCFQYCRSLTTLPQGLFSNNTQATNFSLCFHYCTSLNNLPTDLFKYNTLVTHFSDCFLQCHSLTTLPADLFKHNTLVTNFDGCFWACENLNNIPVDLFRYNTAVTTFSYCFAGCLSLDNIPADLFRDNTGVISFHACFAQCTSLTAIPTGLFSANAQVQDFANCFRECNFTQLPADLFSSNGAAIYFNFCFYDCPALSSLPQGLFSNNMQAESFYGCFNNCTALTTLPDNLFSNNLVATNFEDCFKNCTKLVLKKEIFPLPQGNDQGFFANRTMRFANCFNGVGSSYAIPTGEAPELWNFYGGGGQTGPTIWVIENCFTNANVTNYNDIPNYWKGM